MIKAALARTPELRHTGTNVPVLEFTLAGEQVQAGHTTPFYVNTSLLGEQARQLADRALEAGAVMLVKGALKTDEWGAEGQKRTKLTLNALRAEVVQEDPELLQDAAGGVRMRGAYNRVEVGGNVTRDPELRHTPAGDAVIDIDIACNQRFTDRSGQPQERTDYVRITLWRELAERAHATVRKGMPLFASGMLISDSWEDRDGGKRSTLKVQGEQFFIISPPSRPAGATRPASAPRPAPAQRPAPRPAAAGPGAGTPPDDDLPF
ncbi:single-stranded DNA-binding protein [Deinococcus ficus]|nr:single-stranded DNA-binding protein [Deinococcus ficus]